MALDLEAVDFLIQAMSQCVTNKQASSKGSIGDNMAGTRAHGQWRRSGDTQRQTSGYHGISVLLSRAQALKELASPSRLLCDSGSEHETYISASVRIGLKCPRAQ